MTNTNDTSFDPTEDCPIHKVAWPYCDSDDHPYVYPIPSGDIDAWVAADLALYDSDDPELDMIDLAEQRKVQLDPDAFRRWAFVFDICPIHIVDIEICLDDLPDEPCAEAQAIVDARP